MSKRRKPGEIVRMKRRAVNDPEFLRVPNEPDSDWHPCIYDCGDDECREYESLLVVGGPYAGQHACHVSECHMENL